MVKSQPWPNPTRKDFPPCLAKPWSRLLLFFFPLIFIIIIILKLCLKIKVVGTHTRKRFSYFKWLIRKEKKKRLELHD
jgi:hypothetical protein